MDLSKEGLELLKSFEGLRLTAYKVAGAGEKYYTIGYGHYGPDVTAGMTITPATAEKLLLSDVAGAVHAVNTYCKMQLTQGQFDALVDFAYNCGTGNLKKLVSGRNASQIRAALPLYNKAGGTVLTGLIRRRAAECKLWDGEKAAPEKENIQALQRFLNNYGYGLVIDGIAGTKTKSALKDFLRRCKVEV